LSEVREDGADEEAGNERLTGDSTMTLFKCFLIDNQRFNIFLEVTKLTSFHQKMDYF